MAATTTTAASTTSSASCQPGRLANEIPVQQPAVGIPYGGNHTEIMKQCCKSADVISFYDNCGLYCLAVDQTVKDIIDCCFDKGAPYQDVFYRGNVSASATATDAPLPTGAQASVVASGSGSGNSNDPDKTASGTGAGASETGKSGAVAVGPVFSLNTMGLYVAALLFSATAFGAFQL